MERRSRSLEVDFGVQRYDYMDMPYVGESHDARGRVEEGQCGAFDPVSRRGPATTRLRDFQAHRATLRRGGPLLCRLPLSIALSPGETRVDSGAMGGKERPAPPTLLPPDIRRPKDSGLAAPWLADIRRGRQPDYGGRTCLTGERKLLRGSRLSGWTPLAKSRSLRNWRSTWRTVTTS